MKKNIPVGTQIFLLLLLVIFGAGFLASLMLVLYLSVAGPADLENLNFDQPALGYASAIISQISLFVSGFVLFLVITNEKFRENIRIRKFQWKTFGIILGILILGLFASHAAAELNYWLVEQFPSTGFIEMKEEMDLRLESWFSPERTQLFPLAIFAFAILPAITEEFIFRGILMEKLIVVSGKMHFGVWVSAALFAAVHVQPFNLLPMILMGGIFGYVYAFTKDIRYTIIMHFLYNGIQIYLSFYYPDFPGI